MLLKSTSPKLGALVAAILIHSSLASALPIVALSFPGDLTSISVSPGQSFTVDLKLTADADGISSYGVSMEFDSEGFDAFDVVSVTENLPPDFDLNLTPGPEAIEESSLGVAGHVFTCEAVAFGPGAVSSSFVACSIELQATGVLGTFSLTSGLLNVGVDGLFDSSGGDLSGVGEFQEATVSVVPEPMTSALLAGGVTLLAIIARGRLGTLAGHTSPSGGWKQ